MQMPHLKAKVFYILFMASARWSFCLFVGVIGLCVV